MSSRPPDWEPGKPPIPRWNVRYSPRKDITVSKEFCGVRDGNRHVAEGDRVQIVVDSRARHRGFVPAGEESTHKYREYEVAGVEHEGTADERYNLRDKETDSG